MTDSNKSHVWIAVVAGVAVFATATWWTRDRAQGPSESTRRAPLEDASPTPGSGSRNSKALPPDSTFRIAPHGRLHLDADSLPEEGPLTLVLDLPDEARRDSKPEIRIVSTDGRRIETTANSLAGSGTGVQLEIDPEFLSSGLYMIEIETTDPPPLAIRRYVLEVE